MLLLFRPYCSNDGEEIFCSSRSVLKLMLLHGKIVKHQILIFAGYLAGRISSYFAGYPPILTDILLFCWISGRPDILLLCQISGRPDILLFCRISGRPDILLFCRMSGRPDILLFCRIIGRPDILLVCRISGRPDILLFLNLLKINYKIRRCNLFRYSAFATVCTELASYSFFPPSL